MDEIKLENMDLAERLIAMTDKAEAWQKAADRWRWLAKWELVTLIGMASAFAGVVLK